MEYQRNLWSQSQFQASPTYAYVRPSLSDTGEKHFIKGNSSPAVKEREEKFFLLLLTLNYIQFKILFIPKLHVCDSMP